MTPQRRTEDLIRALAARPVPRAFGAGRVMAGMAMAGIAGLALFIARSGLRADLATSGMIHLKLGLFGVLAGLALWLALRSARPEAFLDDAPSLPVRVGRPRLWLLALPLAVAAMLALGRMAALPDGALRADWLGQTAAACLLSITALSLPPMAAGVALMRRGAPTRPMLSGALLGLAAGAGIATGYALHCTEDSPLFFVFWYGLAIAIATLLGALAGRRFLRW